MRHDKLPYKRSGHRISLLNIARYCSKAPELSEKHGAGRAALLSKAFHAKCAKAPGWRESVEALSEDERKELDKLQPPGDIVTTEGDERVELDYLTAEKEVLLGLDEKGSYTDPLQGPVMLRGYMDFGWVREIHGQKVAYVCDIKLSEWTTTDGPEDLQVLAYAFAYASKHNCEAFVTAIWSASEGTWLWGEWVDLSSEKAVTLWRTVKAAALNKDSGFVTGQHCRGCYARLHCQEHLMPVSGGPLAPLNGAELDSDKALQALLYIQAAEDAIKKGKETLQEAVRRGLEIRDPVTGKVYRPISCKGRETVSVDALKSGLGEEAGKYIKRGGSFEQFRWCKA